MAEPLERRNLLQLAESISASAKVIVDALKQHDLPEPSFAADGLIKYPEGADFAQLQGARMDLIASAWAIEQLAAGPHDYVFWQAITTKHDLTVLTPLFRFGVFEAVPITGDIAYSDLAANLPLTERQLRRLFRHAFTKNIFCEPRPDHVAHTSISMAAVKEPLLKAWYGHNLGEVLPGSSLLADHIEKYGDCQDSKKTALGMAWDWKEGEGVFEWLENSGEGADKGWRSRQFAKAMETMASGGHERSHILNGFDWQSLGDAKVVDVGGSSGFMSVTVAEKCPALRFVVQDLPELRESFDSVVPADLKSRISFETHSFYEPQSQEDVDVFLLRHVLHDWPDATAIKILRNLVNGEKGLMKDGARIVISDAVMPPNGALPRALERLVTAADMQMWTAMNALERRKEDWIALVEEADPRLDPVAFVQPEGSADTLIEVVFRK